VSFLAANPAHEVVLEFGTNHFVADTGKSEQSDRNNVSIVGLIRSIDDCTVLIHPLIMGAPSFDHPANADINTNVDLLWYGYDWYEVFPEDIDEFARCRDMVLADQYDWMNRMKQLSEEEVKHRLCEVLGDTPKRDWAGEQDDHFSTSVHLAGERTSAAFLLKGPAQFKEMTPDMLGKRADQIYRLAATPAQLLVVQHCHDIGEAVRSTLRAFAIAPHNPRRYCLIDGKDTHKILKPYDRL